MWNKIIQALTATCGNPARRDRPSISTALARHGENDSMIWRDAGAPPWALFPAAETIKRRPPLPRPAAVPMSAVVLGRPSAIAPSPRYVADGVNVVDMIWPAQPGDTAMQQRVEAPAGLASPVYLCPLTKSAVCDPVILVDLGSPEMRGMTFERAALQQWLIKESTHPVFHCALRQPKVLTNSHARQEVSGARTRYTAGKPVGAPAARCAGPVQ